MAYNHHTGFKIFGINQKDSNENMQPRVYRGGRPEGFISNVPNIRRGSVWRDTFNEWFIDGFQEGGLDGFTHVRNLLEKIREPLQQGPINIQLYIELHVLDPAGRRANNWKATLPHDNSGMVVHNQNELEGLPDRLLHEHLEPMLD